MKKVILTIIAFVLIIPTALSLSVDIAINDFSFTLGDIVIANLTIYNNEDVTREFTVDYFLDHPEGFPDFSWKKISLKLKSGDAVNIPLFGFHIDDVALNGEYTIIAVISREYTEILPVEDNIEEAIGVSFNVTGIDEKIVGQLLFCKDINCDVPSKVFLTDESIYMHFRGESNITVISPDIEYIPIDNNAYLLNQLGEGEYQLLISLTKDGYQTREIYQRLLVVSSYPEFKTINTTKELNEEVISGKVTTPLILRPMLSPKEPRVGLRLLSFISSITFLVLLFRFVRRSRPEKLAELDS